MASTGVSGFKFDAGEAVFVPNGAMADPNAYCSQWAAFAARFGGGGEVRCAAHSQSAGVWTREFDKDSRWSHHNGLRALITAALHLGLLGYPFVLPDMVGGNAYSEEMVDPQGDEAGASETGGDGDAAQGNDGGQSPASPPSTLSSLFYGDLPDQELYMRWCAANALLPAVQFSIAPWQYDDDTAGACRRALELRREHLPLLEELAQQALVSGEPIVRPLWWHDPTDATCQWVDDAFMLGNRTLVAPILEAGVTSRPVYLPMGRWRDQRRREHEGPVWIVDHSVGRDDVVALFELVG